MRRDTLTNMDDRCCFNPFSKLDSVLRRESVEMIVGICIFHHNSRNKFLTKTTTYKVVAIINDEKTRSVIAANLIKKLFYLFVSKHLNEPSQKLIFMTENDDVSFERFSLSEIGSFLHRILSNVDSLWIWIDFMDFGNGFESFSLQIFIKTRQVPSSYSKSVALIIVFPAKNFDLHDK